MKVLCEIITLPQFYRIKDLQPIRGIILSGGPSTVTNKDLKDMSIKIFSKNIPVLGICYGLQIIASVFGGKVKKIKKKR